MKGKRIRRRILLIALAILLILCLAFVAYVSVYYRADATALAALTPGDVGVYKTAYGWFFDGPSADTALVFYPGAKVEAEAYAPLLRRIARGGVDVCLVRMPFNLALFDVNAALRLQSALDYDHWYIGGHSLGGAMAALCAARHGDRLDGVALCAAYPTEPLDSRMTEVLVRGTADGVCDAARLEKSRRFAPPRFIEHSIEGGNHAQFGSYGPQAGDGAPGISAEAQQDEAARVILDAILGA